MEIMQILLVTLTTEWTTIVKKNSQFFFQAIIFILIFCTNPYMMMYFKYTGLETNNHDLNERLYVFQLLAN
jgi:hypothetical protein